MPIKVLQEWVVQTSRGMIKKLVLEDIALMSVMTWKGRPVMLLDWVLGKVVHQEVRMLMLWMRVWLVMLL